jgi:integrase
LKRARHSTGSLIFDKGRNKWRFLQWAGGQRKSRIIGSLREFPSKSAAWQEVERLKLSEEKQPKTSEHTLKALATKYEEERFPTRKDTARVYRSFITNHILPKWGTESLTAIQPRAVELWLRDLKLSPKSKTHVRSLMHTLFEFAMWSGLLDIGRNPISLVRNVGATQKVRKARNLTVEEFHSLLKELHEPFATLALCCACTGLRISEALALRWSDIDWLGSQLNVERSIVAQVVDSPKTQGSRRSVAVARELLERLRLWKQCSAFGAGSDWVFASPQKIGRLPYSYTGVRRVLQDAAKAAKIPSLGTHALRHSFRTWLGESGVPLETQKEAMRHTTLGMTLNYGTTPDAQLRDASDKVAQLVFNGSRSGSQTP